MKCEGKIENYEYNLLKNVKEKPQKNLLNLQENKK